MEDVVGLNTIGKHLYFHQFGGFRLARAVRKFEN
jgi:hypothetical protein